jgi:hypothetical protein
MSPSNRSRPNMRVQRTRSSPSAPHSPLTRCPLGNAQITSARRALLVAVLAALFATVLRGATENDPCAAAHYANVDANVLIVARTITALDLLNGHEDPKLKQLLQGWLLAGISAAKASAEAGAVMPPASVSVAAPSWRKVFRKAGDYLRGASLEALEAMPPRRHGLKEEALGNLEVLGGWLAAQKGLNDLE